MYVDGVLWIAYILGGMMNYWGNIKSTSLTKEGFRKFAEESKKKMFVLYPTPPLPVFSFKTYKKAQKILGKYFKEDK